MKTVNYQDKEWKLTALADAHHLARRTLECRLQRFGETATGIQRALATGIMTRLAAAQRGKSRSRWSRGGL